MNSERSKKREALQRVKQSLVDDLVGQSDEQILAQAAEDGINPDEARSHLLVLFQKARQIVEGRGKKGLAASTGSKKSTVPNIDAARARAILKRVAGGSRADSVPLLNAAQLVREGDDEVLQAPSKLTDKGGSSDDK